jgi:hypothetical protein
VKEMQNPINRTTFDLHLLISDLKIFVQSLVSTRLSASMSGAGMHAE